MLHIIAHQLRRISIAGVQCVVQIMLHLLGHQLRRVSDA